MTSHGEYCRTNSEEIPPLEHFPIDDIFGYLVSPEMESGPIFFPSEGGPTFPPSHDHSEVQAPRAISSLESGIYGVRGAFEYNEEYGGDFHFRNPTRSPNNPDFTRPSLAPEIREREAANPELHSTAGSRNWRTWIAEGNVGPVRKYLKRGRSKEEMHRWKSARKMKQSRIKTFQAEIARFRALKEREELSLTKLDEKIRQGTELLSPGRQYIEPSSFDPDLLDEFCLPPP